MIITPWLKVPLSEIELTYARSSGPGGQNVNKVNSKAILRWNVESSQSLSEPIKARLLNKLASKLTTEGDLVLSSDRFRDQAKNREDCFEKFRSLLTQAAVLPKARMKTKPSRSSQRRVKEGKRKQSEKKSMRRSPRYD